MAVRIVEPEILQCAWCHAPREALVFARSHRTPRGKQVIVSEVYHCRKCGHQTGTIKAEPYYAAAAGHAGH
jgi:hypothetical protein